MRLLSDRIQEFIDWLEEMTEFGEWEPVIKEEVHKKLLVLMISDEKQLSFDFEKQVD